MSELLKLLETLKLRGMLAHINEVLKLAEQEGTSCQDVISTLLQAEYRDRQTRYLDSQIKQAKFPWDWTLDTFPFNQQPGIKKSQIMTLAKLTFIDRHENLVLIGKPGTGKSGVAMGLLRLALVNGYRGRFYNAQELLNDLYTSLADRTTSRLLKKICNYDIIVIDELGYLTLNTEQINIFFKLIDMRYRKKSTIITTNLNFDAWYDVFKQKELVDAMLDRFKHTCTTIRIDGPSLRTPSEITDTEGEKQRQHKNKKEVIGEKAKS